MPNRKWIEANIIQRVDDFTALIIRSTVWIVLVSGYAVSVLVFVRWAMYSFGTLLFEQFNDAKALMHTLLLAIELLILVPVPAIVGIVTYRTLMRLADGQSMNLEESKYQVGLAEHLLIGLLVTVTGTTMLDLLITEEGTWLGFGGGAILVVSLSFFLWISKQR